MKQTGIGRKVEKVTWSCRYCKTPMDEGKLFSHEATCPSKPKVGLKLATKPLVQKTLPAK